MKRLIILLTIGLTLASCATQPVTSEEKALYFAAENRYTIIPESPAPGEPVTIAVNTKVKEALLFVNGKQAAKSSFFFVPDDKGIPCYFAAVLAIPSTITARNAVIRIDTDDGVLYEVPVNLTPREFRSETLQLTPSLTNLVTTSNEQTKAESARLWQILTTTGDKIYHIDNFVLPITSTRRTSQFGTRRINQYSDGRSTTSIHAGVDFGAPTGTDIFACGRGYVVLARMRVITGNSVIIEHAPGVYSIYYHLDTIIAQEGDIAEAGEIIGKVGSTGFSTGPHLHWELRVSTENTDPDIFVARPILDKELIISKLFVIRRIAN